MKTLKPAATSKTKSAGSMMTEVKIEKRLTVTYILNIVTARKLSMPCVVQIDGEIAESYKIKPKVLNGDGGKIVIDVAPGKRVALFLNSDAHPAYRKSPVYSVVVGDHDVVVEIQEKPGKQYDTDAPAFVGKAMQSGQAADMYKAVLTGDIWMKISHKYTSSEVDVLLGGKVRPEVVSAVRKIYEGLVSPSLTVSAASLPLSITFVDGKNPLSNISLGYSLLDEGLKRVHPAAYAALFDAACDAGIEKLVLTSGWRPMLGSIAHRAGLGLDVGHIGSTKMNREELRIKGAVDTPNVTEEEKRLFAEFENAKTRQSLAAEQLAKAEHDVAFASRTGGELLVAKQKVKTMMEEKRSLDQARKDAEYAWNRARDKSEPPEVRGFRDSLMKCQFVAQALDPWFMDYDTTDMMKEMPNFQINGNEKLHAHYLHITVREPGIL